MPAALAGLKAYCFYSPPGSEAPRLLRTLVLYTAHPIAIAAVHLTRPSHAAPGYDPLRSLLPTGPAAFTPRGQCECSFQTNTVPDK